jgi:hypothetical protein
MRRLVLLAALAVVAAGPPPALAQSAAPSLRPGRIVIGIGAGWFAGEDLGTGRAQTRASAVGTTRPPAFTLFTTESRLGGSAAVGGTVTVAITRTWAVEARGRLRRPTLTTTITGDAEAAGTFTATEDVAEYVVDGSLLYHPGWGGLGSRTRVYLLAGGGYLRQLHDDDVLVATGATLHGGAGARVWLAGGRGRGLDAGLTADLRWVVRRDGITFRDGTRSLPAIALAAFVGF